VFVIVGILELVIVEPDCIVIGDLLVCPVPVSTEGIIVVVPVDGPLAVDDAVVVVGGILKSLFILSNNKIE